jgi:hypothetical protein
VRAEIRRLLGRNYRGIGVGLRVRGEGRRRRREAELVLRVFVGRKVKRLRRAIHGAEVPPGSWVAVGARRRRTWIRTDVDALARGGPHAATDAQLDVIPAAGASAKRGTVCAFVRPAGDVAAHALSCKHMLGHRVGADASAGVPNRVDMGGEASVVDTATRCSTWDPALVDVSRDVGVGKILRPADVRSPLAGLNVTGAVTDPDEFALLEFGDRADLVTRNGVKHVFVHDAVLEKVLDGFKTAAGLVSLRFENVVLYEGVTSADDPAEGDSGGALLIDDGGGGKALLGMHFWGDNASIGAAQFMGDVLDKDSVGVRLKFEPGLQG